MKIRFLLLGMHLAVFAFDYPGPEDDGPDDGKKSSYNAF